MKYKTLTAALLLLTVLTSSVPLQSESYDKRINWLTKEKSQPTAPAEESKEIIELEVEPWPITKKQMATIMGRAEASITDELMDDFTRMVELFDFDTNNIAYFLGQAGAESGGLKHAVELDPGYRYEWRRDLGNYNQGDGVRYAGGGYLQLTGRANYTGFYRFMKANGVDDPKILTHGKHHVAKHYPWTSGGWWWMASGMIDYCENNPSVDRVGARVNGRYLPNGYRERRHYTNKAFQVLSV